MATPTAADQKATVMLAGPGHETVFYQMQPPFLSDTRFIISANATQWPAFGQSLAQMAIAWTLRDPRVTSALIGASRPEQIEENAAALSAGPLEPALLAAIDRALAD